MVHELKEIGNRVLFGGQLQGELFGAKRRSFSPVLLRNVSRKCRYDQVSLDVFDRIRHRVDKFNTSSVLLLM